MSACVTTRDVRGKTNASVALDSILPSFTIVLYHLLFHSPARDLSISLSYFSKFGSRFPRSFP